VAASTGVIHATFSFTGIKMPYSATESRPNRFPCEDAMQFARMTQAALAALAVTAITAAAAAKPVTLPAETNLRAAPGTKSEIITLIPKGSAIEVGECDAGWCKVKFGDKEGFAIGRNLGEAPPQTAAAPRTGTQGQSQANLQKLRHGYEQYFDGNGQNDVTGSVDAPDSADTPYTAQRNTARAAPPRTIPPRNGRPYYDDEDDYYADDDDDAPAVAYVPAGPPPVYYRYGPYPRAYYPGPYYYRRW
jgi:uncharacterized protein YgiM (DUF1202 family)